MNFLDFISLQRALFCKFYSVVKELSLKSNTFLSNIFLYHNKMSKTFLYTYNELPNPSTTQTTGSSVKIKISLQLCFSFSCYIYDFASKTKYP